ncbi:AAA family ATPase [Hyalangium versicolor]|uniref:AAA family ATPase n=1 Tax=Hyalangium versicolor TaxID=2861190 RepID=UPI001CCAA243|nr:ATP-binding protein [Hyalangium versicolor]
MSHPFNSLTIHSLRGVKGLELPGLGGVNLLVGGNDSGKTTVLEALALYCNPLDIFAWDSLSMERESLGTIIEGPPPGETRLDALRWLFPQHVVTGSDEPYEGAVSLSADGTFPIRKVHARYRETRGLAPRRQPPSTHPYGIKLYPFSSRELHRERRGAELEFEATPGFEPRVITLWADERLDDSQRAPGPVLPYRLLNPSELYLDSFSVADFTEARLAGLQGAVKDLLRAFDPRIQGIEILAPQGRPTLYLQDSVAGLAPISAFGDGVRRALSFALTIPTVTDGIVLIDEIETAIHISALSRVFRWIRDACQQYRIQLFVTTHSLEAVDAILGTDTTQQEDIVGFRLERGEEHTSAKRYGEDLLKRLRYERGLDVR